MGMDFPLNGKSIQNMEQQPEMREARYQSQDAAPYKYSRVIFSDPAGEKS